MSRARTGVMQKVPSKFWPHLKELRVSRWINIFKDYLIKQSRKVFMASYTVFSEMKVKGQVWCSPIALETEAGGSLVWSRPDLHSEFKVSLGYVVDPFQYKIENYELIKPFLLWKMCYKRIMCVCVCVDMHTSLSMYVLAMYICVCRSPESAQNVFLSSSPPCALSQFLSEHGGHQCS